MKRLLFIDNQGDGTWPPSVCRMFMEQGFLIDSLIPFKQEFPLDLKPYCCVFLSGSTCSSYDNLDWIQREHDFIPRLSELCLPIMGVCFGSQIIASALCGRDTVIRRSACEVGIKNIQLNEKQNDELLAGLPAVVPFFVWHNDAVVASHADRVILGWHENYPNHIWRFRDLPILGVQGHPELNKAQVSLILNTYRKYFLRDKADSVKIKSHPFSNKPVKEND